MGESPTGLRTATLIVQLLVGPNTLGPQLAQTSCRTRGEGTPAAKHWLKTDQSALFQGHADEIADQLAGWAERRPAMREGLLAEADYFEKHQHRMNYMEMREEGWVIGSGMVESGVKQYKDRFSGPDMRWSQSGAERLIPVRSVVMSGTFQQAWKVAYNSPKN